MLILITNLKIHVLEIIWIIFLNYFILKNHFIKLQALGLDDNDFKFGLTKVFFRPGKFAEFDQILKSDPENLRKLIAKVKKWILCSQWKKAQWCALSVIKLKNKIIYRREALVTIQKWTRMYLAYKQHAHRYKGVLRLKKSKSQIEAIGQMSSTLKPDAKAKVQENVKIIYGQLDSVIGKWHYLNDDP